MCVVNSLFKLLENQWTVETDMSKYKSFNNYMLQNIQMEKELWDRQQFMNQGDDVDKINRYFNATPVKRMSSRFFVEAKIFRIVS